MVTTIATVIGIVFGGILNMAVAVWAEHQRRPRLTLSIELRPPRRSLAPCSAPGPRWSRAVAPVLEFPLRVFI